MGFKIETIGSEKPISPQLREAFLFSYRKPPDTLQSNWLITSVGLTMEGDPVKNFEYRLSGALFEKDVTILKRFGNMPGQRVVLTLRYVDIPAFDFI